MSRVRTWRLAALALGLTTVVAHPTHAQPTMFGELVGALSGTSQYAYSASLADIDNDGDLDLVITANNGPARLLRNDRAQPAARPVRISLEGSRISHIAVH